MAQEEYDVFDVFTPTTQARVNFVPRPVADDAPFDALRTPGKQVIVYGESGSGKSTLLQRRLEETYPAHVTTRCTSGMAFDAIVRNAFDALGAFYRAEATSSSTTSYRSTLAAEFLGIKAQIDSARDRLTAEKWARVIPPELTVQRLGEFIGAAERCWILEDFHKAPEPPQATSWWMRCAMAVISGMCRPRPPSSRVVNNVSPSSSPFSKYQRSLRSQSSR